MGSLRSFVSVTVSYGYDRTSERLAMNYLKSALAGLVAVFVICLFLPALPTLVRVFILASKYRNGAIGIKVSPLSWQAPSLAQSLFMLAVFVGGFLWELRRLAKRQLPTATDSTDPPIS